MDDKSKQDAIKLIAEKVERIRGKFDIYGDMRNHFEKSEDDVHNLANADSSDEWKVVLCGYAQDLLNEEGLNKCLMIVDVCMDKKVGVFTYIDNIQDVDEKKNAVIEAADEITRMIEFLFVGASSIWRENADRIRAKEAPVSMIDENNNKAINRYITISELYILLGDRVAERTGDDSVLRDTAVLAWQYAISTAKKSWPEVPRKERNKLVPPTKQKAEDIYEQVAQCRFDNYWAAHQTEKANFESEKQSLDAEIATSEREIQEISEQTDGYANMVELQKEVQNLTAERKALGFFKFKAKKTIMEQINSSMDKIAPIQARINSATKAVQERISQHQSRINEIDKELTKPR